MLDKIKGAVKRLAQTVRARAVVVHDVGSYQDYRATQIAANKQKLDRVFAERDNIHSLGRILAARFGGTPRILCHGTRNGSELRWFKEAIPGAHVLGTDISDTATQFPDMIEWDFHKIMDGWVGTWDAIYSNSWDHAFDPQLAFANWAKCLAPNGIVMLEHTSEHTPAHSDARDPFGATRGGLKRVLKTAVGEGFVVSEIGGLPVTTHGNVIITIERHT